MPRLPGEPLEIVHYKPSSNSFICCPSMENRLAKSASVYPGLNVTGLSLSSIASFSHNCG